MDVTLDNSSTGFSNLMSFWKEQNVSGQIPISRSPERKQGQLVRNCGNFTASLQETNSDSISVKSRGGDIIASDKHCDTDASGTTSIRREIATSDKSGESRQKTNHKGQTLFSTGSPLPTVLVQAKKDQKTKLRVPTVKARTVSLPATCQPNLLIPVPSPVQRSCSGAKELVLQWVQDTLKDYPLTISNFSSCWSSGLAFCALIHAFFPESFDWDSLTSGDRRHNFSLAFKAAEDLADICPLLEVEDMLLFEKPDWKCVFCYVQSFYRRFKLGKLRRVTVNDREE